MGILTEKIGNKSLNDIFANYRDVEYMHKISDREFWNSVDEDFKNTAISNAEKYLNYDIPAIKATSFITFHITGNRLAHENPYFARRRALNFLVIAECLENKGRFVNDIIDLVWAICEETTWALSAHVKATHRHDRVDYIKEKTLLPEHDYHTTDLNACDTSASLSSVIYMMKDVLNDISPMIYDRVKYEITRRIIKPFTEANGCWWMDLGKKSNNWAVWCVSNILWSMFLIEKDDVVVMKGVKKSIDIIDNFLHFFEDDGACEEGPTYFVRSGLSLYDCLERLYKASEGKLSIYDNDKIDRILRFYGAARLTSDCSFNYADAACKVGVFIHLYPAARRIGDKGSMALAAKDTFKTGNPQDAYNKMEWHDTTRTYEDITFYNEMRAFNGEIECKKDVWYPENEVLISRTEKVLDKGMVFAVKGYHNDVSHNHNDAGSFVLYNDSKPIFIDVGVETYRKETFSELRYTIWTMRSIYHNLPVIGEIEQKNGEQYRATDVQCDIKDDRTVISMDIAKAYPERVEKWVREYDFDKVNKSLTITDDFKLDKEEIITFNFMTLSKPVIDGKVIDVCGVKMSFDGIDADVSFEEITLDDPKLRESWGDTLYRVSIKSVNKLSDGKMIFKVK